MKILFCTTCKGRVSHLRQTLPQNLIDNSFYPNSAFVVLNYNSPDGLDSYIKDNYAPEIEYGKLITYRFTEPTPFRMAHAKNLAHRLGIAEGADVLVNLDADNYTGPNFASYIANKLGNNPNSFLWAKMKKGELPRGISGRIVVPKHEFLKVGGYDETFSSWGPDDKDFNQRLQRLGIKGLEIDDIYLKAVNHNDKMRFSEYPHARLEEQHEDWDLPGRDGLTITNAGKFGCGVVYRNSSPYPIEFSPVPTRIFGIGWHKTGTTSLHHALETLGYDSAHWISAHWAKRIWEEMANGRSLTLEQHYALCDFPISLLYKELDATYPGSKFILTKRDEVDWVESARAHWSGTNPFRSSWNNDPFSHYIHKIAYGQRGFDAEIFLNRYRQHNADVIKYFKGRNDLLIMDLSNGAGWYELCGFLKQPIPPTPFPRKNISNTIK